ncbi:hypothetical protein KUTeg_006697 [Tegillarca granosa]|uniref:E3 ubiquitin-protein ligase parkin n=1 Tax=Tegillarca granosa TaxID=220873 RepID=A0ABQ9FFB1_TEGGR|nr:hypothetical protein KUTeg_006697 [Tegillarca granosa]
MLFFHSMDMLEDFVMILNKINTDERMSSILLNVKFNSNAICSIEVELSDTLKDVKMQISSKLGIPLEEIQIILAGKVIEGNQQIKDLCLGNHTVLHAFRQKNKQIDCDIVQRDSAVNGADFKKENVHHYFVYCQVCKGLRPGKLRVMCAACKDGHVLLNRDPENFDDVLIPGRITAECKNSLCNGGQQVAKFYFKCYAHDSKEGDESVVLKHVYPNTKNVECITCCEYERFKRFGTEEFVLQNGGILCPAPGCGAGFLLEEVTKKIYEFCSDCRNHYHGNTDCSLLPLLQPSNQSFPVDEEQALRATWDRQSLEFIGKSTKPCPKCKTQTEKDGGCMHMACTRCKFEWCWLCEEKWNRDCMANHWFD